MEILPLFSGPFVFLDVALPFVILLMSALILTGNFAVKTFFDRSGIGLYGRYTSGGILAFLGLALTTGLEAVATQVLIALLIMLAVLATCRDWDRHWSGRTEEPRSGQLTSGC